MNRDYYDLYRNGRYVGALFPDDDGRNPREEFDNMGHMICWHNHYLLGDKDQRTSQSPEEWFESLACEVQPGLAERLEFWDNDGWERVRDIIERNWRTRLESNVEDVEQILLSKGFLTNIGSICAALGIGEPEDDDPRMAALTRYIAFLVPIQRSYYDNQSYVTARFNWQHETKAQIARAELAGALTVNRDYLVGFREAERAATALIDAKKQKLIEAALKDVIILELGLLDHSGLHMYVGGGAHWSDSAGWDSGTVGFIWLSKEEVIHEYGDFSEESQAKARKYLEGEVETYDQYLTGDVWGYRAGKIPDEIYAQLEAGEIDEDEIDFDDLEDEDSCWGFYGNDYTKEELKSVVDYMAQKAEAVVA